MRASEVKPKRQSKKPRIKNNPILTTFVALSLASLIIGWISAEVNYYRDPEFWKNLAAGLHNTVFDLLFIGVLIFWLNKRGERRIEVQRYRDDIDLWRDDASATAKRKNLISIRRLNEHKVYDIDLSKSVLQGIDLSGLKFIGGNLEEAKCYETIFKESDLTEATLDKANLKKADFTGACLAGVKARGAILDLAVLQGANLKGADFTGTSISGVIWAGATYDKKTKFPYEFDRSEMKITNTDNIRRGDGVTGTAEISQGRSK